jgi:hypothetical protein
MSIVNLKLKELLEHEIIRNHKCSEFSSKLSGTTIILNKEEYEIRVFFFQGCGDILFGEFAKNENLLEHPALKINQGYAMIYYFTQPDNIKTKGIYYLIGLRKLGEKAPVINPSNNVQMINRSSLNPIQNAMQEVAKSVPTEIPRIRPEQKNYK